MSPWTPRLVAVVRRALRDAERTRETEAWYLEHYFGAQRPAWLRAQEALLDMQVRCAEAGAAFGVAYFPLLHAVGEPPLDRIADEVRAACDAVEIPFVDLTPALEDGDEQRLWLHPVDHHPNARAHRLVAEPLAAFAADLLARSRR